MKKHIKFKPSAPLTFDSSYIALGKDKPYNIPPGTFITIDDTMILNSKVPRTIKLTLLDKIKSIFK